MHRPLAALAAAALALASCSGDDDAVSGSSTSAAPVGTEVDAAGVVEDAFDPGYSGPALPVSTVFEGTRGLAEPWILDPDADDCGFEIIYGPLATCTVVGGEPPMEPFTIVLHELTSRTVAFIGCGDDESQVPVLTADGGHDIGVWSTTTDERSGRAGYVVVELDAEVFHVAVVSADEGVGEDGCPVVYDVGEFTSAVALSAQRGVLRIEDGDIRYCIIEDRPGEFLVSDSGFPDDPC